VKRLKKARRFLRELLARTTKRLGNVDRKIAAQAQRSIPRAQIKRGIEEVHHQEGRSGYLLGGGHGRPGPPWDCSGWQGFLARVMGCNVAVSDTYGMAHGATGWLPGRGRYYTCWIKTGRGGPEDHVIGHFEGTELWNECGGRDNPDPRGGPHMFRPSASRLTEFHVPVHPAGL
jgi:hypothetical protein